MHRLFVWRVPKLMTGSNRNSSRNPLTSDPSPGQGRPPERTANVMSGGGPRSESVLGESGLEFRAPFEDRVVEISADAARYPDQPDFVSGIQALEAFGSGACER